MVFSVYKTCLFLLIKPILLKVCLVFVHLICVSALVCKGVKVRGQFYGVSLFLPLCRFRGSNSATRLGLAAGAISLSPFVKFIAGYFMKEYVIYKYKYRQLSGFLFFFFFFLFFEIGFLYVALLFWSSLYRPGWLQTYRTPAYLCLLPPLAD